MKTNLRYQNGSLYEHHGAWFVRYKQRISEQDGSANLSRVSKYLGRSKDFPSISVVERSRRHSCKRSIATGPVQIRG
jgi:hypothetical protein